MMPRYSSYLFHSIECNVGYVTVISLFFSYVVVTVMVLAMILCDELAEMLTMIICHHAVFNQGIS